MATNNATNTGNPITVAQGGTGDSSLTAYAVLCGGTTSTGAIQSIAALGSSGNVLTSNGAGALPTFQAASGGISTLDGNSGSATGSTVTITTGSSYADGSAAFTGSSATLTLTFTDANGSVGLGTSALANASSTDNVCVGSTSGQYISTGYAQTFVGFGAGTGQSGTHMTSIENTGIGYGSLGLLTSGLGRNTAVGFESGSSITTSIYNTCIGAGAIDTLSNGSGENTGVGYYSLNGITSGAYNTCLGSNTGTSYSSTESSNICIGYNTNGTAAENHILRIGNGTGTSTAGNLGKAFICGVNGIVVTGATAIISTSDQLGVLASSRRFKSDIQDMKDLSSDIYKLRPVTFVWNKDSSPGLADATDARQVGLIAEEVAEIYPDLVNYEKNGIPLNVKYENLPAMLLNEIQKLNKRIEALESK